MLTSPISSTPDAIETVENTACESFESGREIDSGFLIPPPPVSIGRSKARVRCTWKDCDHREPDGDEMK